MDSQGRVGEHLHLSLQEEPNRSHFNQIVGCFKRCYRPIQSHKTLFHALSQITVEGIFAVQTIDGSISHDFYHSSLSASKSAVTSVAHFQCSYSGFNQFSCWQTIRDTNEKMSQLTQGMVEK